MAFWIFLAIVMFAVAALLLAAFIRWLGQPTAEPVGDVEVYRDLLNEIQSKLQQGAIDDTEAEAARLLTVKRALATASSELPVARKLATSERNVALVGALGIVALGLVGLFAATPNAAPASNNGSFATQREFGSFAREQPIPKDLVTEMQAFVSETRDMQQPQGDLPPVDEMIRRLAARLQQNPKDSQGWRTLGWSYLNIGRYSEASDAYAKAVELSPGDAEVRGARVEALVRSTDGVVNADARSAIEDTLKIDSGNGRARFYKGLASAQDGDKTTALTIWREVLKEADPNESWVPDLKNRIGVLEGNPDKEDLAGSAGSGTAIAMGSPQTQRAPVDTQIPPTTAKGPNPQDVQAAEAMAPADRSAMIRGMVDRLARRLEKSPRDADGWIKLIQSRMVLGETELAKQALASGTGAFADDSGQRDRIVAAAQKLGLSD